MDYKQIQYGFVDHSEVGVTSAAQYPNKSVEVPHNMKNSKDGSSYVSSSRKKNKKSKKSSNGIDKNVE